jgi:transposase-like protein
VLPSETKPKSWTAEEKLRVLAEAHGLTGEPLGELLRREGVHEAQLRAWRDVAAGALAEASPSAKATTAGERRHAAAAAKQVKELQRELRRKEKALAEAAALLVLEKKLKALGLDVEDDDTDERSDR